MTKIFLFAFLACTISAPLWATEKDAPSFLDYCNKQYNLDETSLENGYTVKVIAQTTKIDDCEKLTERLSNITNFNMPGFGLLSIDPIADQKQFKTVNVSINKLTDVSSLGQLKELEALVFSENNVSSLEFVKQLTKLTQLKASNNDIVSIEALRKHPTLTEVVISGNPIKDLSPLASLELTKVSLIDVPLLDDALSLQSQPKLTVAELNNAGLTTLENVASKNNSSLTRLLLADNNISDISPVANLPELSVLDLNNNPVANLRPLTELSNLRLLGISNNKAPSDQVETSLSRLKLVRLEAANAGIQSLDWIENMKDTLVAVDLNDNQITDPSAIYLLNNVTELRLAGNPIKSFNLDWLRAQKELKLFEIDLNKIEDPKERSAIRQEMFIIFERTRI